MLKESLTTAMIILLVLLASGFGNSVRAGPLASAQLGCTATVAAVVELTIVEPVIVSFAAPWDGYEQGQALVFNNVGSLLIESNANWALSVSLVQNSGWKVYVKPAQSASAQWSLVEESTSVCTGSFGSEVVSLDVKVEKKEEYRYAGSEENIQFAFTVEQI
ncbi:MAG: hypothetical protein GX335_08920 [Firmicutes bacterium]|nr:hypothetical protein [Bacillota bacterium]